MSRPLFLQRVETVYSIAQLQDAPDLRPPQGRRPLPRGLVNDAQAAVGDLLGSRLPVYAFSPSPTIPEVPSPLGAGGKRPGLRRGARATAHHGSGTPAAAVVYVRSFGSLTDLEAAGACRRAEAERVGGDERAGGSPPRMQRARPPLPESSRKALPSPRLTRPASACASPSRAPSPSCSSVGDSDAEKEPWSRGVALGACASKDGHARKPPSLHEPARVPTPPLEPGEAPAARMALPPLPTRSLLDRVLLTEWEVRSEAGLFRYDISACATRLLRGSYGFVAQLNPGRGTQKRPSQVRVDAVDQAWDDSKFNFTKARQCEVLLAFQPQNVPSSDDGAVPGGANHPEGMAESSGGEGTAASPVDQGGVDQGGRSLGGGAGEGSGDDAQSGEDYVRGGSDIGSDSDPEGLADESSEGCEPAGDPRPTPASALGAAPTVFSSTSHTRTYAPSAPTPQGPLNLLLVNVSPIEYGHVLLIPDALSKHPQRAERNGVALAAELSAQVHNPYFRVGFNSLGAYGTVNHLHYQAYYLAAPMPAERAPAIALAEGWKSDRGACPPEPHGVRVLLVKGYPVRGVVLEVTGAEGEGGGEGGGEGATDPGADLRADHAIRAEPVGNGAALAAGDACRRLASAGIPHNLLIADAGKRIFIFPNVYSQRKARGEIPDEITSMGVDPACWEISGHMIYKRQEDYDDATESKAWNLLRYASLEEDEFYGAVELMFSAR